MMPEKNEIVHFLFFETGVSFEKKNRPWEGYADFK